jgi:hypothetical protein
LGCRLSALAILLLGLAVLMRLRPGVLGCIGLGLVQGAMARRVWEAGDEDDE